MNIRTVDEIVFKGISEIKPYFRNPRDNEKTVRALVKLIPQAGFNVPILIDDNNVIVKGHARYKAAIQLGMEKVPCVYSVADEETNMMDRLADNKTSELAEWVDDKLRHELDMLDTSLARDIAELGFPVINTDDLFAEDIPLTEPEEDRRSRYQQYLEDHPQEAAEQITSKASIDRAIRNQQNVPEKPKRYYKVVCECCGHIMFVAEGEAIFEDR